MGDLASRREGDGKPREGKNKRTLYELVWGRSLRLDTASRSAMLVFVVVAISSMSFTQLGFWSIGEIAEKPVYLLLLLGPLMMGAMQFGPIMGALLGLFAGIVVFGHASVLPLDFYEVYFMTPLNSIALLTVWGACAGFVSEWALRADPKGVWRVVRIIGVCVVFASAAGAFVQLNTLLWYRDIANYETIREILLISPLGFAVQTAIDAFLMSLLCCVVDFVAQSNASHGSDRALFKMFRNWMLVVSSIVIMVTSGVLFSVATFNAQADNQKAMASEVAYLQRQLGDQGDSDVEMLLDGYTVELDGYLAITDKNGYIIATDDEELFAKGASFSASIGDTDDSGEGLATFAKLIESDGETLMYPAVGKNGVMTMDAWFLYVGSYDDGYIGMIRTSEMVYASRFGVMAGSTFLALALVVAIALVATILLSQVVVKPIDKTNDSLGKITEGNLSERVTVRDTREFASLSMGINATVSALKESIAEAEQKNAQELMTAKAIQESSLPREFPPFPDIDKFDIYASMKTAKEVGGDFYNFFLIDDDKLGFVIADVSGKGIPAALFMMTAKTQIQNYMDAGLSVEEAINAANHQLCIGNDAGMFVTVFACLLDYRTGELSYVNAGHNPPLILKDGAWEWMRDVSGMPLGLFDGMPYDAYTRTLETGDVLYLYTDGVTEAMDADGNLFGEKRLEETLCAYASMNPRSIGVGVRRALTDFTLDAEQSDDITMLALKYGVPPEKRAVMIIPALDTQLVHVYNFIHEELHRRNAPKSAYNPLDIAAEELFVNVCHYAYPDATPDNPGEVRISFEYESNPPSLTVEIADDGVPYDPLAKPDAVTPDDIADVPIGGLGILMAKQSVDKMSYRRENGSNITTFSKGW